MTFACESIDVNNLCTQWVEQVTTIEQIFQIPESADLGLMFQTSFVLVLVLWLTSWGFGVVVNYFNPKHER